MSREVASADVHVLIYLGSMAEELELVTTAEAPSLNESPSPTEGTLAVLYDEIGSALHDQHAYVESLNQRAQQLFSFATVIVAILVAVVPTHPDLGAKVAYVCALPIFALAAFYSGRAWEFRKWRTDPKVSVLWDEYRGKSEEHVRHQVILNRLKAMEKNEEELLPKLKRIKHARLWLYCGSLYVAALLLYQVISG